MKKNHLSESLENSHFFIYVADSIYVLKFCDLTEEDNDFNDSFLQENVKDLLIAAITKINYSQKKLATEIKEIFDEYLTHIPNRIIQVIVSKNSAKHQLIKRFINDDNNSNFFFIAFYINDEVFYYFLNDKQTNPFTAIVSLINYIKSYYGVSIEI